MYRLLVLYNIIHPSLEIIFKPQKYMQTEYQISPKLLQAVSDTSNPPTLIHNYIRNLSKQIGHASEQGTNLIKQTMISITNILKDPTLHPKIKFQAHQIIMFLIMMADPDIYEHFSNSVYTVLRANCMYNKGLKIQARGEDFFKQSKFFTDPNATAAQKSEIKKTGSLYLIFCLETVYMLAKWLPLDLEDDTQPTSYSIGYENLKKAGVQFPKEENFKFYCEDKVEDIERVIRDIEKEVQSVIRTHDKPTTVAELKMTSINQPLTEFKKVLRESMAKKDSLLVHERHDSIDMETKSKLFFLEEEKKKLLKQIDIQRNFYQSELEKERNLHRDNIFMYEKKITKLEEEIEKLKSKILNLQMKSNQQIYMVESKVQNHSTDKMKDKLIQDLQLSNKQLNTKIKKLEEQIEILESALKKESQKKNGSMSQGASLASVEIQKLKKQNKSLKAKILTQCSQASQFSTKKSNTKTQNSEKQLESLKFLGYENSRSSFEPFYSNSSTQVKIRLRKAILREKELLYRDKNMEIGCITKLQGLNSIRMITVFTNISEKPLFNFSIEFLSREDIVVKILQNTKNYLEISGQTKSEVFVTLNQFDFRCLLCSVRYNLQQQTQKIALIMPISKLKLAHQQVYTPIRKQEKLKKVQKLLTSDKKILPSLHKFKDYFEQSLLDVDRTLHETYYLKVQFMGIKLYVECDEVEGQLRIAVRYYEDEDFSRAEKFLEELAFLFGKG